MFIDYRSIDGSIDLVIIFFFFIYSTSDEWMCSTILFYFVNTDFSSVMHTGTHTHTCCCDNHIYPSGIEIEWKRHSHNRHFKLWSIVFQSHRFELHIQNEFIMLWVEFEWFDRLSTFSFQHNKFVCHWEWEYGREMHCNLYRRFSRSFRSPSLSNYLFALYWEGTIHLLLG